LVNPIKLFALNEQKQQQLFHGLVQFPDDRNEDSFDKEQKKVKFKAKKEKPFKNFEMYKIK